MPWLTADVLVGATEQTPALAILGDAERCVAWALIEDHTHAAPPRAHYH